MYKRFIFKYGLLWYCVLIKFWTSENLHSSNSDKTFCCLFSTLSVFRTVHLSGIIKIISIFYVWRVSFLFFPVSYSKANIFVAFMTHTTLALNFTDGPQSQINFYKGPSIKDVGNMEWQGRRHGKGPGAGRGGRKKCWQLLWIVPNLHGGRDIVKCQSSHKCQKLKPYFW